MLLLAKDCEDAWSFGLLTSLAVFSSSSHILHAVMPMLRGTDFPSQGSFRGGLFALQCFRNTQLSLSQKAIPSEKEKGRKERGKVAKQQQRRHQSHSTLLKGLQALLCMQRRGQITPPAVRSRTLWNSYMHTNYSTLAGRMNKIQCVCCLRIIPCSQS